MKKLLSAIGILLLSVIVYGNIVRSQIGIPFPGPGAAPGLTPIALISGTNIGAGSTDTNVVTTASTTTTGGNFIASVVSDYIGGDTTACLATDSKSNSYTGRTAVSQSGTYRVRIFDSQSPTVGASHTFTACAGPSGHFPAINAATFSHVLGSSAFDVEATGHGFSAATSCQAGSVTPSGNNSLIIAGIIIGGTISNLAIDSSLTIGSSITFDLGTGHEGGALAYFVQGSAAAINPNWTWTTAINGVCVLAVYKHS